MGQINWGDTQFSEMSLYENNDWQWYAEKFATDTTDVLVLEGDADDDIEACLVRLELQYIVFVSRIRECYHVCVLVVFFVCHL